MDFYNWKVIVDDNGEDKEYYLKNKSKPQVNAFVEGVIGKEYTGICLRKITPLERIPRKDENSGESSGTTWSQE